MSQKRTQSPSLSPASPPTIFKSDPIEDRSSKFIGIYSPNIPALELREQPDLKDATHRIAAWRKSSSQRNLNSQAVLETGYDDDGEKYGGKTVEKVLISLNVEGAVVVARWYGGIMLGPVRFDHIRNCASQAVRLWKQQKDENWAKRLKVETEARDKDHLVQVLHERDQSIAVLRGLLAEMTHFASSSMSGTTSSVPMVPDYSALSVATLQKLETVRDKTISWVLQEIEKAEETKQQEALGAPTMLAASPEIDEQPNDGTYPAHKSKESVVNGRGSG